MLLHIDVVNKVATFQKRDGCIVCGNSGYQIEFNLDSDWNKATNAADLKAVFIWDGNPNGNPTYVQIDEKMCDVPIIKNADKVIVGVVAEKTGLVTTGTEIPCKKSILCK